MSVVTPKMEASNWRNWALKTLAGTQTLIGKIELHCPEAIAEAERCVESLKALDKKIRENQPVYTREHKPKVRRIFVS